MSRFHLPRRLTGVDEIRRYLKKAGWVYTTCQIAVGVVLPLAEAVLVNIYTGQLADKGGLATATLITIVLLGLLHLGLLGATIFLGSPLPQFLVEFDQQAALLERGQADAHEADARAEQQGTMALTFWYAVGAAQLSLEAVNQIRTTAPQPVEVVVKRVLDPWVRSRSELFWFNGGDGYYNFSVYLYRDADRALHLVYRDRDDRIQSNDPPRTWRPGNGHVGLCFSRELPLFAKDVAEAEEILGTGRAEDAAHYRAMASAPIWIDGTLNGVLIVTSSMPNQMLKDVHLPLVELAAKLIGTALSYAQERDDEGNEARAEH